MEKENKITIEGVTYNIGNIEKLNSGEVYLINDTPHLAEDCEYDFAKNKYVAKNSDDYGYLIKGIIDYNGDFIFGKFSPSYSNIYINTPSGRHICIAKEIINKFRDSYIENNKYEFIQIDHLLIKDKYEPFRINKDFKSTFPYNANDKVLEKYLDYFNNVNLKISTGAKQLSNLLDGLSIGVEFETEAGLISEKDCLLNGLIPLRDGSITGLEYVTIPLSGEKGSQALINTIELLHKHARIDHSCALHYHIGNIPRTKEFIVALWIVITLIQRDLYKYQSPYKSDNRGFKNKDYTKPLPNLLNKFEKDLKNKSLDDAYDMIIDYLSMGEFKNHIELKDIKNHPRDPEKRQKWHVKTRYHIVNIIPLIFGNKKTVEFRHHDINLNPSIIVNELVINVAIVKFVLDNMPGILSNEIDISFNRIIENYLVSNVRQLDSVFTFLDQKRSDLCQSFNRNELFSDLTFNKYKSVVKTELTEGNIDKLFDIEFYKKWNKRSSLAGFTEVSTRIWEGFRSVASPPRPPSYVYPIHRHHIYLENNNFEYQDGKIANIRSLGGNSVNYTVEENDTNALLRYINNTIDIIISNNIADFNIDDMVDPLRIMNIRDRLMLNHEMNPLGLGTDSKFELLIYLLLSTNDTFLQFVNSILNKVIISNDNRYLTKSIVISKSENLRYDDNGIDGFNYYNLKINDLEINSNLFLENSFLRVLFVNMFYLFIGNSILRPSNNQFIVDNILNQMRGFGLNFGNLNDSKESWINAFNDTAVRFVPAIYLSTLVAGNRRNTQLIRRLFPEDNLEGTIQEFVIINNNLFVDTNN